MQAKIKKIFILMLSFSLIFVCSILFGVYAADGIIDVGTSPEALYAEFNKITGASSYNAYVKEENDANYTKLDSQLVRELNSKVRIDAVGLSEGEYSLKFVPIINSSEDLSKAIEITDIEVDKMDRSGYAHFNYNSGVGAYNDNGTLKANSQVIYVTDETKNTVEATIGNQVYVGLGNILQNLRNSSTPICIRLLDVIKTTQWNTLSYSSEKETAELNTEIKNSVGGYQDSSNKLYASTILQNGYNSYSNDLANGITTLENINNSFMKWDGKAYDSCWNDMKIDGASNVTIEGIGDNAGIYQWGLTFARANSIEIKNLTFDGYTEDACAFQGTNNTDFKNYGNYWVHNCTFNKGSNNWDVSYEQDKYDGDGTTDFKFCHNVTVSYCKYNQTHKTSLIGSSDDHLQYNFTLHHNYYFEVFARLPYTRQANIHMYNNYYFTDGQTKAHGSWIYNKEIQQFYRNSYGFMENCYFKNYLKPLALKDDGAVKCYNTIFDASETDSDYSIVSSRTQTVTNSCMADGSTDYSTFDTSTILFYYDSINQKSDVEVMHATEDLPTIIPSVAGAGISSSTTYSVVSENELVYDNTSYAKVLSEDFSDNAMSITKTSGTPTNKGLYYKVKDSNNEYDSNEYNNVTINNGRVKVYDNSTDSSPTEALNRTTNAYYMFGSNNYYNSGIVKYSLDVEIPVNSSWKIITFINTSDVDLALYSNSNKYLCIRYNNSEVANITTSAYSAGTYHVVLEIDYDNNKLTLSVGDNSATITNYNSGAIKGLLFTTSAGSARTYYFDNVEINVKDNLKLGYQLGRYTSGNTEYKALRIIGRINYNNIYDSLDDIATIKIVIEIVDTNENVRILNKNITDVYSTLSTQSGKLITDEETNDVRYYYSVIKGITSDFSGYKINARTVITLNNGVEISCSGFSYTIS